MRVSIGIGKDTNYFTTVEVGQNDVEKIKQALTLLEVEAWEIRDDKDSTVEKSPLLIEYERKLQQERQEREEKLKKLTEEFNSLPRVLHNWEFPGEVEIYLERSDGEYDIKKAWHVLAFISTKMRIRDKVYDFYLSDYISADGKVLRKKFFRDWGCYKSPEISLYEMAKAIPQIEEIRKHYYNKYLRSLP